MIYEAGKKQCSNSGRKRNDIDPLESDFTVQPPSLLEFPGPLTPPPPWNFQFPPWWGSGYFLESHNIEKIKNSNKITPPDRIFEACVWKSYPQVVGEGRWRGVSLPPSPMDGMIATDPLCVSINGWQGSIQQDIYAPFSDSVTLI